MKATIIPYSSTVGTGIMLMDDDKVSHIAMLALNSVVVPDGETHRTQSEKLIKLIAEAINNAKLS